MKNFLIFLVISIFQLTAVFAVNPGIRKLIGSREYLFSHGHEVSWHEAKDMCVTSGMQLISIETIQENNLIKDYLKEALHGFYWTSGTDVGRQRGDYIWDSTGRRLNFQDFHYDESSPECEEHYLAYLWQCGHYKWSNEHESNKFLYICEEKV